MKTSQQQSSPYYHLRIPRLDFCLKPRLRARRFGSRISIRFNDILIPSTQTVHSQYSNWGNSLGDGAPLMFIHTFIILLCWNANTRVRTVNCSQLNSHCYCTKFITTSILICFWVCIDEVMSKQQEGLTPGTFLDRNALCYSSTELPHFNFHNLSTAHLCGHLYYNNTFIFFFVSKISRLL